MTAAYLGIHEMREGERPKPIPPARKIARVCLLWSNIFERHKPQCLEGCLEMGRDEHAEPGFAPGGREGSSHRFQVLAFSIEQSSGHFILEDDFGPRRQGGDLS